MYISFISVYSLYSARMTVDSGELYYISGEHLAVGKVLYLHNLCTKLIDLVKTMCGALGIFENFNFTFQFMHKRESRQYFVKLHPFCSCFKYGLFAR